MSFRERIRLRRIIACVLPIAIVVAVAEAGSGFSADVSPGMQPEILPNDDQSTEPPPRSEAFIAASHVQIRLHTEPGADTEIALGQQTRLLVEILTDTWFSQAPRYPELNVPGAIALLPEAMGSNFTEQIDGVTFAGQRRGYVIFPQRVGTLEIPTLDIHLGVAQPGSDEKPFVLTTPSIRLRVVPRAGAEDLDDVATTTRLIVNDDWNRSLVGLEAGDAIVRTVRLQGDQTLGMLLPQLIFDAPAGVAVYADQPRILDHINRGQYRGERVQKVTYVLQRSGSFEIPAIELNWWDPALGELHSKILPGQTLAVRAKGLGDSIGSNISAFALQFSSVAARFLTGLIENWVLLILSGLMAIALFRVSHFALPRGRAALGRALEKHRNSEGHAFRALQESLSAGEPTEIVRCYWLWRDRLLATRPEPSPSVGSDFTEAQNRSQHWRAFEASRYGSSPMQIESLRSPRSRGELGPEFRRLRADFRAATRKASLSKPTATLNPSTLNPRG